MNQCNIRWRHRHPTYIHWYTIDIDKRLCLSLSLIFLFLCKGKFRRKKKENRLIIVSDVHNNAGGYSITSMPRTVYTNNRSMAIRKGHLTETKRFGNSCCHLNQKRSVHSPARLCRTEITTNTPTKRLNNGIHEVSMLDCLFVLSHACAHVDRSLDAFVNMQIRKGKN